MLLMQNPQIIIWWGLKVDFTIFERNRLKAGRIFFPFNECFRFLKNISIFKSLGIEFSQLNKYTYCIFEELEISSDIYQVDC